MRTIAILALLALVAGCATPPPRLPDAPAPAPVFIAPAAPGPLLARDKDFAVVVVQQGDTLEALAERYLGNPRLAWRIGDYNDVATVRAGDIVTIPLTVRNVTGVTAEGYQTVPILCYHRFGPRANKLTVTPAAFEQQMDWLARNGWHVVSLAHLTEFLEGKRQLPAKSVAITIDDGYRSTYEVAYPILKKYGFPATVFLYTDFVGAPDAMTWAQMKELESTELIQIQPHSKSHANLTVRQPGEPDARYRERVRREVEQPINALQERLAVTTATYAYPYGDVNEFVVDELTRRGVKLGVTVTPGGNGAFAYPFLLRRSMIFGDEDLDAFKRKLTTFTRAGNR